MINSLKSAPEIRHFFNNPCDLNFIWIFSPRSFGNMSFSYGDTQHSADNRSRFLEKFGIDYRRLVCAKQVHSDSVKYVTNAHSGSGAFNYGDSIADTDAFITDKRKIPLAIFSADCLCVFLYDPRRPAVGLIHAGWRSTKEDIIGKTIQLMRDCFDSRPADLMAGLGPAIRNCCYRVKEDFESNFPGFITKRKGRYYMDLPAAGLRRLSEAGIKKENIFDSEICASCRNKEYFSHRREGDFCGRTMSVAMLR